MKFAVVGEGLTDYQVIRNLLIGFFEDKNLPITRLLPKDIEPVGWGNVLKYIATEEFKTAFYFSEYITIQIDTKECEDWGEGLNQIGDDVTKVDTFISSIIKVLIKRIGEAFYEENKEKILFAITVHEIECWMMPFTSDIEAHFSKMVTCSKTLEQIAKKKGFSLHQKNYQDGKKYDELSKIMRKKKDLIKKIELNPSLKIFIETQLGRIPQEAK